MNADRLVRLLSLAVICALGAAPLAGWVVPIPAQAQTLDQVVPLAALAGIAFPGVKSPPSAFGVYLGHGLVITNWHPWTFDGRYYTADDPPISPSRQIVTYDDDGVADPGEQMFDFADCDGVWTPLDEAGSTCQPFVRVEGAGFVFPGAGDARDAQPVPILALVYASRADDIALFAVDADAVEARGVIPARLSLEPPTLDTTVVSTTPHADQPPDVIGGAVDSWQETPLPADAPRLGGPWQVPSVVLNADSPLPEGAPVFDANSGDLLGLVWRSGESDGESWITPAARWGQALLAANDALRSDALRAVLAEASLAVAPTSLSQGDPLTPELGSSDLDVLHYALDLAFDVDAGTLSGTAVLDVRARTEGLLTFALDGADLLVTRVTVDGADTPYVSKLNKLIVQLPKPLDYGTRFQVAITYSAAPQPFRSRYVPFFDIGMFFTEGRVSTLNEPDAAHTWFPCNDHPSDRATYDFRLRVPDGLVAVANGQPVGAEGGTPNGDGTRTFVWSMPYPMATYLAMVAIADYTLIAGQTSGGLPIRNYLYSDHASAAQDLFAATAPALDELTALFGPYPFASYGHVVVPRVGMALETQTMTIMPDSVLGMSGVEIHDLLVHELAHQWFGNTVTPATWADIWLNEGFATLAEWLARESEQGAASAIAARSTSEQSLLTDQRATPLIAPDPSEMFGIASYDKGAWVLHMLRNTLGDETFFALLRVYLAEFADRPATSLDLWQLAEQVSGQDLAVFFDQWLLQGGMPRYTLYWTETAAGADVLLCPTRPGTYTLDLPLRFATETQQWDAVLTVPGASARGTFALPFIPTRLIPDPDQNVLAGVQVQPIAGLPILCPPPVAAP